MFAWSADGSTRARSGRSRLASASGHSSSRSKSTAASEEASEASTSSAAAASATAASSSVAAVEQGTLMEEATSAGQDARSTRSLLQPFSLSSSIGGLFKRLAGAVRGTDEGSADAPVNTSRAAVSSSSGSSSRSSSSSRNGKSRRSVSDSEDAEEQGSSLHLYGAVMLALHGHVRMDTIVSQVCGLMVAYVCRFGQICLGCRGYTSSKYTDTCMCQVLQLCLCTVNLPRQGLRSAQQTACSVVDALMKGCAFQQGGVWV